MIRFHELHYRIPCGTCREEVEGKEEFKSKRRIHHLRANLWCVITPAESFVLAPAFPPPGSLTNRLLSERGSLSAGSHGQMGQCSLPRAPEQLIRPVPTRAAGCGGSFPGHMGAVPVACVRSCFSRGLPLTTMVSSTCHDSAPLQT